MLYSPGSKWENEFCIVIPSWNNLPYLIACIESIRKYSIYKHQIVVHLNEGTEEEELALHKLGGIEFTKSTTNLGVCGAVNKAANLCKRPIIMYMNDDMIVLPKWDTELVKFYEKYQFGEKVWLSSTMIEPTGFRPEMVCGYNFGRSPAELKEHSLLIHKEHSLLIHLPKLRMLIPHQNGSTWPPNLMFTSMFEKIGGFSEEFWPGFGSDPELDKKMWDEGVRDFVGVGTSLVYHFQCITSKRVAHLSNGHQVFEQKHGMTIDHLVTDMMKRGTPWQGPAKSL